SLSESILVTAPTAFQVAAAVSGPFSTTLTLPSTGGTVYVQLNSATQNTFSGDITHSSTGAATKIVAVSGVVSSQICVTSRISAGSDDVEQRMNTGETNGDVDLDGD